MSVDFGAERPPAQPESTMPHRHLTPAQLIAQLEDAFERLHQGRGDEARKIAEQLIHDCPGLPEAYLARARAIQLDDGPLSDTALQTEFNVARDALKTAIQLSHRSERTVEELAHFVNVIDDEPAVARPLFLETLETALDRARRCAQGCFDTSDELGDADAIGFYRDVVDQLTALSLTIERVRHKRPAMLDS